ncbi:MAG: alpha/beta fold hydrolase [Gammaproteobacteria bacterium]
MTQATATTLAAAGYALEVARVPGTRSGPTLVLLHEGLGSVAQWRGFPAALAARSGLPVLAYSRPGYGRSSSVPLPRPLDFHTRDALEVLPRLLDAAGIEDCVLVGHSDGASIALIYAGATRDPRVRGLVVMAPHVLTEAKTVANIERAREAYADTDLRAKLARYHGENVDCAFRGWCDTWLAEGFREWNIEQWLPGIRVPVLIVRGKDDPYNTPVHVDSINARVSGPVTRVDLDACGHAPHLEQEGRVLDAIEGFLQTL